MGAVTLSFTPNQIVQVPIERLIPYARNARTHDDRQVAAIAASLREFGWTNPVLIDAQGGIIAGHGRVLAARKLGLTEAPCIRFNEMSPSMQRNGVKDCICNDCSTEFTVRKDTNPVVCRRCASSRGGKVAGPMNRGDSHPCKTCNAPIRDSLPDTYCSIECRKKDKHIDRTCKYCGNNFQVYKSALKHGTNSAGNFCSRQCYEQWLCNTERVKSYGVSWKKRRKSIIEKHPFCAICGTTKNLQVHHIVPYRITLDNREENLIPLCVKHHKTVETITHDIEMVEDNHDRMLMLLNNMLRSQQQATLGVILNLLRGNREQSS